MIRFCVEHPVATWMLFAALIICGAYALPRLDIEAMPETELPSLTISTRWTGASPSAVQQAITIPIEEAARKCHGVEELTARSMPGQSRVTVAFRRDVDIEFARLELAEQLGSVRRNLPAGAFPPSIQAFVPQEFRTEDFFQVSLVSPLTTNELRDQAETWLLPRILSIPGVADAELQGGARPLVKVLLDLQLMERYYLTADAIASRLDELDDIVPAGVVRTSGQQLTVSVRDSVTVEQLEQTVLHNIGGQSITLGHVARVERSFEDPFYFVRINGQNVISLMVSKRSGQNAVAVSRTLRETLPRIQDELPFPVSFEIEEDNGKELEDKLRELVYRSLVILALLFILLAIAMKQVRLTAIVVFSILLAIVICLSLFYFLGISVNFITISGLTVCFGMLLDNSILVLDAIHRRLTGKNGGGALPALVSGTREVAFPILATTFTTVVAFLSFIFLTDRLSLFYVPLAISVGIAMLASIFVAFCWIPVALRGTAQRMVAQTETSKPERELTGLPLLWRWGVIVAILVVVGCATLVIVEDWRTLNNHWLWVGGIAGLLVLMGAFVAFVEKITELHLRFWWYPVVLMFGLFVGGWWVFDNEIHQGGFWRRGSQEELVVYLERPVGTDVMLSTETMKLFEAELLPLPDGIHMRSTSYENWSFLRVEFDAETLRSAYPEMFRNRLIVLAEELGGMFIWINGFGDPYMKGGAGGGMSNSTIKLTGYNSKELDGIADRIQDRLRRNRRVRNVRLTSGDRFDRNSTDETVVIINRDVLASHRLSVMEVMGHLRRLLGVETPWHMIMDGEDQQIQLSFDESEAIEYSQIMGKTMVTSRGERIQLGRLVTLQSRPVVSSINREDQRYSIRLNWEYVGTDRMRQKYILDILAGVELPYGYTAEDTSGEMMSREEEEQLKSVLWITLVFIFMALAALFESFTLPLLVLLAIPMALTGVVGIFWATDSSFDSSAKIGLVLLFGIVVNNAILLINRYRLQVRELVADRRYPSALVPDKRRLGGVDLWRLSSIARQDLLREAICVGTRIQMRSILLTSGTTIAGLIPLLIKITDTTEGKDIWENLALSSIGGLASSTILILSAIPATYWIMTRFGWALARGWTRLRRRAVQQWPVTTESGLAGGASPGSSPSAETQS